MKRLSEADARRVYGGGPAKTAGPSKEDLKRWQWLPSVDSKRPFELVVTEIETRSDTSIQAGDEIIVIATEYPKA